MAGPSRLVACNIDPDTLGSLAQAFPGWEIEEVDGVGEGSGSDNLVSRDVNLLVMAARGDRGANLVLCRALRRWAGSADLPLLVLVPPAEPELVREMLDAGANACLVLPVHHKEVTSMLVRAQRGNQPGRHTRDLHRAQTEDRWRDDGGEG